MKLLLKNYPMVDVQDIKNYVRSRFPAFGINRRQEIARLLYEISLREKCHFRDILTFPENFQYQFVDVKRLLMKRRFPRISQSGKPVNTALSELEVDPGNKANLERTPVISPEYFYFERSMKEAPLIKRLKSKFPAAIFAELGDLRNHQREKPYQIKDYNDRLKTFYIVEEKFDFYKQCPCSVKSVFCGYHVVNLGSGCPFECAYCYLQDYLNAPGISIPGNLERFFQKFTEYKQNIRIGSGELTDSLAFDNITEFSPQIVNFFRNYPLSFFEFKTKSSNIDLLLTVKPSSNIVISWSMNPQSIISGVEHFTASLNERIESAAKCAEAGYKVAFHFDPVFYFSGWEDEYRDLVDKVFAKIEDKSISWVSMGTFRMTPRLKKIIENRFPGEDILNEEFVSGHDGKLRYHSAVRLNIYSALKGWIREKSSNIHIYLCMEDKDMCQSSRLPPMREFITANKG